MRLPSTSLALLLAVAVAYGIGSPDEKPTSVLKSISIDSTGTLASLALPCLDCYLRSSDFDSLFDLAISIPSPSGTEDSHCSSNISVNSVPLHKLDKYGSNPILESWERGLGAKTSTGDVLIPYSGYDIKAHWTSSCYRLVYGETAVQILSLAFSISSADSLRHYSIPSYTLSIRDSNPPEILRFASYPSHPVYRDSPDWIKPPSELRVDPSLVHFASRVEEEEVADSKEKSYDPSLEAEIKDLRLLEAELKRLREIIEEKKKNINTQVSSEVAGLKAEVKACEGVVCILKAVFHKLHDAARLTYLKIGPNPYDSAAQDQAYAPVSGQQAPAMIASTNSPPSAPQPPEQCHCSDGKPSEKKNPFVDPAPEQPEPEKPFQDAVPPSKIYILMKLFLIITGVALIFSLFRKLFCTDQKRRDCRERRERRAAERAYRSASRRQAFWDWWYNKKRGNPGRRPGDYDEKRTLVYRQEALLEEHMQDDIRQLQIQEEIRQFRTTTDLVDDLIRAEEGRIHAPAPPYAAYHPSSPSSSTYPAGFVPLPRSIVIPNPSSSRPSTAEDNSDVPFSPVSRTTSLPSYRSKPPSYRSGDESDSFSVSSGMESSSDDENWGYGSSIPDISPRPSGDTFRTMGDTIRTHPTGETVRSFL